MRETLDKILKIEADSEDIKRNSKSDASKIKDEAVNSGRELIREKKREANAEAHNIIVKAHENADSMIAGVRQDIDIEYKNLTVIAERNIEKSAEFIVERIISDI